MSAVIVVVLCVSQAVQACVLVYVVMAIRGHDRVLRGLPQLLARRDEALVADAAEAFERKTYAAINQVMNERAVRKAEDDASQARDLLLIRAQEGLGGR